MVLIQNDKLLYGPAEYNVGMIKFTLNEEELTALNPIPSKFTGEAVDLGNGIKILPETIIYPNLNTKIEQLSGPSWVFSDDIATGTYNVAPKSLESVKNDLKSLVASERYAKETADFHMTVNGVDVIVEGSRENKTIFMISAPFLSETEPSVWKFPKSQNFVPIVRADIYSVIYAFATQTQNAFDWESAKVQEIDACTTLAELDAVIIVPTEPVQGGL